MRQISATASNGLMGENEEKSEEKYEAFFHILEYLSLKKHEAKEENVLDIRVKCRKYRIVYNNVEFVKKVLLQQHSPHTPATRPARCFAQSWVAFNFHPFHFTDWEGIISSYLSPNLVGPDVFRPFWACSARRPLIWIARL